MLLLASTITPVKEDEDAAAAATERGSFGSRRTSRAESAIFATRPRSQNFRRLIRRRHFFGRFHCDSLSRVEEQLSSSLTFPRFQR